MPREIKPGGPMWEKRYDLVLSTPLPGCAARIGIQLYDGAVIRLGMVGNGVPEKGPACPTAGEVARQMDAYLKDGSYCFDLPLTFNGTPFQRRVWAALQTIPAGETWSYARLAENVGSGARAVANACRQNPIPLIVPCHRVISMVGTGGFMGRTEGEPITIKNWLLKHEEGLL